MIYVPVEAAGVGLTLARDEARAIVELEERIKDAAAMQLPSIHSGNPLVHTINQTEFPGPLCVADGVKTSKNAMLVSPGRMAGGTPAVQPEISGRAWLTGIGRYGVDPDDPFPEGYRLGDTWFR